MIYKNVSELLGKTPLMELCALEKAEHLHATILAKIEYFNPAGSVKDRVAAHMIDDAQARGLISPGATLIEPTSGNTGIGLAAIGGARGYRVILTMPDTMSIERRKILAAYGAEIVLTEGSLGMSGAIAKAEELKKSIPNSFIPSQFTNPANAKAHYLSTGPEIYDDTEGHVDIFIAGAGTGGTITGVGRFLKEKKPHVKLVAVEPSGSAVLSGENAGPHGLMGIGAGFVPEVLDTSILDEIMPVSEENAYKYGRFLARNEGILCGITSGAAVYAAVELAKREENLGKTIVVLLPDTGERSLSTPMFE